MHFRRLECMVSSLVIVFALLIDDRFCTCDASRTNRNNPRCIEKSKKEKKDFSQGNQKALCQKNIRRQRDITNNITDQRDNLECSSLYKKPLATNDFVAFAKGLKTKFFKESGKYTYHYANVTWQPVRIKNTSRQWNHYAVLWASEEKVCYYHLVPKNQTFYVINLSLPLYNYKYPNLITYNVSTYPYKPLEDKDSPWLTEFGYPIKTDTMKSNKMPGFKRPSEITPSLMAAIIVGCCAGVAFFVALVIAWYYHRRQIKPIRITADSVEIEEKDLQIYLSYYNENQQFTKDIEELVQIFQKMGYDVIVDQMHTNELAEEGVARWAQTRIASSSKVLVACTPKYLEICRQGKAAFAHKNGEEDVESTRVWFEIEILTNIYTKTKSASKMVCLWMTDKEPGGLPPWMSLRYSWPADINKIAQRLMVDSKNKKTSQDTKDNRSYSWSIEDDVFDTIT